MIALLRMLALATAVWVSLLTKLTFVVPFLAPLLPSSEVEAVLSIRDLTFTSLPVALIVTVPLPST